MAKGLFKKKNYSMSKNEERLELAHPLTDGLSALLELSSWHTGYRDTSESLENTSCGISVGLKLAKF